MEKTGFDPIADAPRRAEVAVLFKRAILTGQSEPGQKLNKLKISGQMRMSRAPLRAQQNVMFGTMSIAIWQTCSPMRVAWGNAL
jgi:hypothetical protein